MNLSSIIASILVTRSLPVSVGKPQWLGQHTASNARKGKRAAIKLIGNRQWRRLNVNAYRLRGASQTR